MNQPQLRRFVVEPSKGWWNLSLKELREYRELLGFLVWRDIKVRYKQTVIGVVWAVLQPLIMMAIFAVFFGRLGKIPSDGVPYPVFTLAALVPWQFVSTSLALASTSLVTNQDLIRKVYFPRILSPISSLSVGLLDFCIAFAMVVVSMVVIGIVPSSRIFLVPLFMLLAVVATLGAGLWLASLNAKYRDIQLTIPFLIQIWLFASPIVYSGKSVPEPWRPFYALNPMVGVVDGVRWCLFSQCELDLVVVAISSLVAIALLLTGLVFFSRTQDTLADVL